MKKGISILENDIIYDKIIELTKKQNKVTIYDSLDYFVEGYKNLRFHYIDIEVISKPDYAYADDPYQPINLISLHDNKLDMYFFFTFRADLEEKIKYIRIRDKYTNKIHKLKIYIFNNEKDMLVRFCTFVNKCAPYLITGWNFEEYDIPYIIRRMTRLDMRERNLLSIDGYVYSKIVTKGTSDSDFSRHGFRNFVSGINVFDMLWGYNYIFGKHADGNGLGRTGIRHLGIGKTTEHISQEDWYYEEFKDLKEGEIYDEDDLDGFWKFVLYGFYDVYLLMRLEEECNILRSFYFIICFTCGEWEKLHHETVLLDIASINFKEEDLFLETKRGSNKDKKIKGAKVIPPEPGFLFGYTMTHDFSREYPNIIRGANLGKDTYIKPEDHDKWKDKNVIKLGNGHWFRKDKTSFASKIVTFFFALRDMVERIRKKHKDNRDLYKIWSNIRQKIKDLINAIYGWMTNPHTRIFHLPSAESITWLGRQMMDHNEEYTHKFNKLLKTKKYNKYLEISNEKLAEIYLRYGDTDSSLTWTNLDKNSNDFKHVIKLGKIIEKFLNKSYDIFCTKYNMFREYTSIEFESIYKNMLFLPHSSGRGKKKNYCAWKVWDGGDILKEPEFIMKGLSGKKGNSPKVSKDIQENVFKLACSGASNEEIIDYLRTIIDEVKVGLSPDKETNKYDLEKLIRCGIPHHFNKDPFDYKTNDASVKAVKNIYKYFNKKMGKGDSIIFFYIKDADKVGMNDLKHSFGFDPEEPFFPDYISIDIDMMIERTLEIKVKDVLPLLDITWMEVLHGYKERNLEELLIA